MLKNYKSTKGITLIALVITIIILLILAGISISALTNQGLFKNAKEAKNRTTKKIKPKPTPTNNPFFPTIFAAISPPIKLPIAADIVTTIEIAVAGTLNLTMAKANRADNPIITKVPINTPKIIARSQTTIDLFWWSAMFIPPSFCYL